MNFFTVLFSSDFPFVRNALIAGALSAVLFGMLGSLITVRRIASLAGAVSHAVLGGIGMALFVSAVTNVVFPPMLGAFIFAALAAVVIGLVTIKAKQREDTVINAIWAIGMSIGVLFMAKTPGYTDPSTYLFGNILLVSNRDLILLGVMDVVVMALTVRFYPQIEASSFDEEFARTRGVSTDTVFLCILLATAAAIVLLQTFVGIVMLIAMLTLPAGIASKARSLASMMAQSSVFGALFFLIGLIFGWTFDFPIGAATVVIAGAVFLFVAFCSKFFKRR